MIETNLPHPFIWLARVYWEDTDGGGVVYHARYVHFLERARTELLRSLGYAQRILQAEHDLVFAIRRMEIDFISPARMDDELKIITRIIKIGAASVDFSQTIWRDDEQITTAMVYSASLNASRFKPVRIPKEMLVKLQSQLM